MRRAWARAAMLAVCLACNLAPPARALTLVAPEVEVRGVDAGSAAAFELLLAQALDRQVAGCIERRDRPPGTHPCAEPACAAHQARQTSADGALLCSLVGLGDKFVVTAQCVDPAGRIVWSERFAGHRVESLDSLATCVATAVAALPPSASRPLPATQEAAPPSPSPAHHGWSTQGPRVGSMYPAAHSYAGVSRLTTLAYVWRYQTPAFDIESVPALGYTWGSEDHGDHAQARDWTLLDLFVTWTPAQGEFAPYIGSGLGLHALRLRRNGPQGQLEDGATAMAFAVGAGVLLFRNYDFQIDVDLRYRQFLHDFDPVGGQGARGLAFTVGIQHR